MKKISQVAIIAMFLAACNLTGFHRGEKGLEYKIISDGKGEMVKYGDFIQMNYATYYNNGKTDTLLQSSENSTGPVIQIFDSTSTPLPFIEALLKARNGDSLVFRVLTDSAFKDQLNQMPPFMKRGHYLITSVRIVNIFKDATKADSATRAEMKLAHVRDSVRAIAQKEKDIQTIQDYLNKKHIKTEKTPLGTFVEIIKPGEGPLIDTSVVAVVNYTGRTLDGTMFDSNTDSSKGHVAPFKVNMTKDVLLGGGVIEGWYDGLKLLNKGAVARFYIPSPLAYGHMGNPPTIKPNSILIFDIEVKDIISAQKARGEALAERERMKALQKHWMDSVRADAAKKGDTLKKVKPQLKKP